MENNVESNMPLVSICILNFNGRKFIERCLSSVFKTNYPNFEVILVDNGSSDGSNVLVSKFVSSIGINRFRAIFLEENKGFAGGHNVGALEANGKYIAFLNIDTEVEPDWLHIIQLLEKNSVVAAVQPLIMDYDSHNVIQNMGMNMNKLGILTILGKSANIESLDKSNIVSYDIFSVLGAAFVIRKRAFMEVGMFDEDMFLYFEESDMCWRLWLYGYEVKFCYNPGMKSKVYHKAYGTITENIRGMRFFARNRAIAMFKNLETGHLAYALLNTLMSVGTGVLSPRSNFQMIKGLVEMLPEANRKRKRVQTFRKKRDNLLFSQWIGTGK